MSSALLLAAGKATRLEGIREQFAKANVPIANTTPLRFMLERLAAAGITEIWVNLHYHAQQVREEALKWASPAMTLHFLSEPQLLGTGGTLLAMVQQSGGLPDVIVNAKMFTDFDFKVLTHASSPPTSGVMVLHPPTALADYGGLTYGANGLIDGLQTRTALAPPVPLERQFSPASPAQTPLGCPSYNKHVLQPPIRPFARSATA